MSSQRKGIRLSSSDARLKRWWKYVSSQPEKNGAQHIQVALNYHKQTNRYLTIGQIDRSDQEDIPNSTIQHYLTDELSLWLKNRADETGLKTTQVIKAILENSISDADSYSCLSNAEIYNYLIQPSIPVSEPVKQNFVNEEVSQEKQKNDIADMVQEDAAPPAAPTVMEVEEENNEEEYYEEEELDLISAMLRENGGGLGA